jgi:hypothetical protein
VGYYFTRELPGKKKKRTLSIYSSSPHRQCFPAFIYFSLHLLVGIDK